jgi:hypothetical protein
VIKADSISIFKCQNLEKLNIPNIQQAYFVINDMLEVLTRFEATYYDTTFSKKKKLPEYDFFKCGTVNQNSYRLAYNSKTKKHNLSITKSYGGANHIYKEIVLELKNLPDNIESISFLNASQHIIESVNNTGLRPNLIRVTSNNKVGIYAYDIKKAIYPKKKIKKKYLVISSGDSIPIPIPFSIHKKGRVTVQQLLPIIYDSIKKNKTNGLIYLYKDNLMGFYPKHITSDIEVFEKKTQSFYKITKNGKQTWLDIGTFKEYYIE